MNKPVRIQLNRIKGFNLQEHSKTLNGLDAIVVSRPSKFGNPFKDIDDMVYVDAIHKRKILDRWVFYAMITDSVNSVSMFRDMFYNINSHQVDDSIYQRFRYMRDRIRDLENKNLACFCPLNTKCHADILLNFINYIKK